MPFNFDVAYKPLIAGQYFNIPIISAGLVLFYRGVATLKYSS
jgi:hypothetical protein